MGMIVGWAGVVMFTVGVIWLAINAWMNQKPVWAICNFCLSPIAGGIYTFMNFDEAKIPGGIMLLGFLIRMGAIAIPD